ncbi:MAG TPA: SDR family NAD(P)-dependent oxidoreductase [Acidobacteriaceae bacterium]|nr:SDR family NAD(P)-dependent oxidoreductase [Acidobacteriaceae bacterium]
MALPSENPIILVTGANRGLGAAVCRQLLARGCTVIAACRRSKEAAGGEPVTMDVTDESSIGDAVRTVRERWGHLDALVNNAGIVLDSGKSILDLPIDVLRTTLETNFYGPLRVAQAVWPLLQAGGRIVNVSSLLGQLSGASGWAPAYSLSKTALNGLTVQLALAGKEKGIAVNSLSPGWMRTDMGGPKATRTADDGAADVVWLLLDAPDSLTGSYIRDRSVIPW